MKKPKRKPRVWWIVRYRGGLTNKWHEAATRIEIMKRQLYEIIVHRGSVTDEPRIRTHSRLEVTICVLEAMKRPFTRIEIMDCSHWNEPGACSVTMLEDCPTMS